MPLNPSQGGMKLVNDSKVLLSAPVRDYCTFDVSVVLGSISSLKNKGHLSHEAPIDVLTDSMPLYGIHSGIYCGLSRSYPSAG